MSPLEFINHRYKNNKISFNIYKIVSSRQHEKISLKIKVVMEVMEINHSYSNTTANKPWDV